MTELFRARDDNWLIILIFYSINIARSTGSSFISAINPALFWAYTKKSPLSAQSSILFWALTVYFFPYAHKVRVQTVFWGFSWSTIPYRGHRQIIIFYMPNSNSSLTPIPIQLAFGQLYPSLKKARSILIFLTRQLESCTFLCAGNNKFFLFLSVRIAVRLRLKYCFSYFYPYESLFTYG